MKKLKPISRVVTYDHDSGKILLVRNKGATFWYAPGGGWEYETEDVVGCATREVLEETGLHVEVKRLLYVQEFHAKEGDEENICLEIFWLANLSHEQKLNKSHIDLDPEGSVEEAAWFSQEQLTDLKVFPKRLKNTFWSLVKKPDDEDPFIGIS
jgi:ADP-ribose pyrophosphatase YjhB (NUDIX family)